MALTRDNDITKTPTSVAAAMETGARLFILRGQMSFTQLAEQFVSILRQVNRYLDRNPDAFIARIRRETFPRGGGNFVVGISTFVNLAQWRERSRPSPGDRAP